MPKILRTESQAVATMPLSGVTDAVSAPVKLDFVVSDICIVASESYLLSGRLNPKLKQDAGMLGFCL